MSEVNVLFINISFNQQPDEYAKVLVGLKRKPLLNFQILSSCLKQEIPNIKTHLIEFYDTKASMDHLEEFIQEKKPIFIGIYVDDFIKVDVAKFVKMIHPILNGTKIVAGGPSWVSEKFLLDQGIDYICLGEGENFIVKITKYLLGECKIEDIKNVAYLKDNEVVKGEPEFIQNLDLIPFADRELCDINDYYDYRIVNMEQPYMTVFATKGCFYSCTYCSMGRISYRLRSVDNLIEEFRVVQNKYGLKYVGFVDDMFGVNLQWLEEFCHAMIKADLGIKWSCQVHPTIFHRKHEKMIPLMKKAGLDLLIMGLQTLNPEVAKKIDRNPNEAPKVREIVKRANEINLATIVEFIIGLPGATMKDYEDNFKFSMECMPMYMASYPLRLFEGTAMWFELDPENKDLDRNEQLASSYMFRYFFHPRVMLKWGIYILRNNPLWGFRIVTRLVKNIFSLNLFKYIPFIGKTTKKLKVT